MWPLGREALACPRNVWLALSTPAIILPPEEKIRTNRSGARSPSVLISSEKKLGVLGPRSPILQVANVLIVWVTFPLL